MPVDPQALEFFQGETRRLQGTGGAAAPEDSLPESVAAVCNALGAERAIIFLSQAGGKELVSYIAAGMEYGAPLILPADSGIAGEVLRLGTALVVNDLTGESESPTGSEEQLGFRTLNVLSAPLRDGLGRTFGVFQVMNKPGGFTPTDQALILPYVSALSDALHPHVRAVLA
jgi:GAF domain-containing protein